MLETNECVILPGLGGFVTTHIAARYDTEKGIFMPPYRTLAFQTGLTTDDGVLIQSYMEVNDLSYPEAATLVRKDIQNIKDTLAKEGYFNFDHIGRLSQNVAGRYYFSNSSDTNNSINSPDFFGLTPVSVPELTTKPLKQPQRVDIPVERKHRPIEAYPFYSKKGISIHFSTSTLNKIAGIVIMFLLVFLFATPFGTLKPVTSYSGFALSLLDEKETASPRKTVLKRPVIRKDSTIRPVQRTEPVSSENYCIVLASGVTKANGEAFIQKLAKKGIKTSLLEKGKMRRVVYSSFTSKDKAQAELRALRETHEDFSTAWVMKN